MSEILVRLDPAPHRRWFAVSMLTGLGGLLFYILMAEPPAGKVDFLGLLVFAVLALWSALRLYRATEDSILLTREGLATTSDVDICAIKDIESTDKGFFAFKPANGFLIRLKTPGPRHWAPGVWWRMGKRVGIGGITSPRQAKEMIAMIDLMVSGAMDDLHPLHDPEDQNRQ